MGAASQGEEPGLHLDSCKMGMVVRPEEMDVALAKVSIEGQMGVEIMEEEVVGTQRRKDSLSPKEEGRTRLEYGAGMEALNLEDGSLSLANMQLIVDLDDTQGRLADSLHLDSVADAEGVVNHLSGGEGQWERAHARHRGVRARFPSDRTLRSMLDREMLWAELLLDKPTETPWFLAGDLNVIAQEEEKRGGVPFQLNEGVEIARFMVEAGVMDAGFSGSKYTWCNNRQGRARIWKRLDRVLLNLEALQMGSSFLVQHLARDPSDHSPLLMTASFRFDHKPKPFRFLNVWTTKAGLRDVIRDAWSGEFGGSPLGSLASKLRAVKQALKGWSRDSFGDIFKAVKEAERAVQEAEVAQEQDSSDSVQRALNVARERLRVTLVVEEGFWKQKARVRWLKDGDRNTKYFHAVVAERRSRAIIHRIRGPTGAWVESEDLIGKEAIGFFQGLFTAEAPPSTYEFLNTIPRLVTDQDNSGLMEPPTLEDVKKVIFSMDSESVVGPDGFTGEFFTFAWDVIAEDVYQAVLSFFCGAELPRSITATNIVLIPKVQCPQDFTQYCLISLCNFLNKVLSRILSDRLAKLLPRIISPQQSGFVKGRQIADNFLLAQELVADIGKQSRGGNVVLKLDMMKAYDRVSWYFLLQVLRRFGFSESWIDAIWRLVSNVWFSVLINGTPQGFFRSTRGLRQGDPLSPALFVIGSEALSRALNAMVEQRQFQPYKIPIGCPIVTHLAFADDVVIFTSGLKSSLRLVMRVVEDYCEVSGQKINKQKSAFLVHPRLSPYRCSIIRHLTGFQNRSFPIRYLGCPLYTGRRKKEYFGEVCKAIVGRILFWKQRILSPGGRVVLLKHVLSSLPIHLLAAASPTKGVLREIEREMAAFLWGSSEYGPRFHWMKWEDLCRPQGRSLWASFIAAKYCRGRHPCLVEERIGSSYTWRRMCMVQGVMEENIGWIVRSGTMDFWHDNWTGSGPLCRQVEVFQDHRVADFVIGGEWSAPLLSKVLQPEVFRLVMASSPPALQGEDRMVWMLTPAGEFSVASAMSLVRAHSNGSLGSACIWHRFLPVTISFFMLRLLSDRLPLMEQLRRFGVQGPSRCCCCINPQEEQLNHLFCTGETARQVWKAFDFPGGCSDGINSVRHRAISWWIRPASNRYLAFVYRLLPSLICWEVWRARTNGFMQGGRVEGGVVITRVMHWLKELLHLQFPSLPWAHATWVSLHDYLEMRPRRWLIWPVKWLPPPEGYKLNTDGCSLGNPGRSGGGGLLRDCHGGFLFGFSCYFGITTSLHAELRALVYGVRQCVARGYTQLHLEVDSLTLVQILSGGHACPWRLQVEVDEILRLQSLVRSITHCWREANQPADRLAKLGAIRRDAVFFDSFDSLPLMARGEIRDWCMTQSQKGDLDFDSKIEKAAKYLRKQTRLQKQTLQPSSPGFHITLEIAESGNSGDEEMAEENRNNGNNQ
nr:uncharacterized protein LOC113690699 [Coffea arabica]